MMSEPRSGVSAILEEQPGETSTVDSGRRHVTRRNIQIALGVTWLFDGILQLQPFMFSRGFATKVIGPSLSCRPDGSGVFRSLGRRHVVDGRGSRRPGRGVVLDVGGCTGCRIPVRRAGLGRLARSCGWIRDDRPVLR